MKKLKLALIALLGITILWELVSFRISEARFASTVNRLEQQQCRFRADINPWDTNRFDMSWAANGAFIQGEPYYAPDGQIMMRIITKDSKGRFHTNELWKLEHNPRPRTIDWRNVTTLATNTMERRN